MDLRLPVLGDLNFESDLRTLIKEIQERNTRYTQDFLHKCYENVLFDYGRHWITFDTSLQKFRPKRTKKWIPKSVTNKFGVVLRPLVSTLVGFEPILQYAPTSENPEDVATANVASRIVEVAKHETNIAADTAKLARWEVLTGNAWLVSGYDGDERNGMVPEQAEMCVACQKTMMADDIQQEGGCPFCKEAGMESPGFTPAFDQGQPVMGQRPRGVLFSEIATVFEMEYDHEADDFYKSLYALRMRSRDREWAKSRFNLSDEELKASTSQMSPLIQQRYLQSLAFISPLSYQIYFAKPYRENRVLVSEMWIDPTRENPEGVYAILIGDIVAYQGPYKYHAPDSQPDSPKPMRPIAHFGYQVAAGRVAYRTPADDLTMKQRTRNELEAIWKLHSRRAANSILWVPDGTKISKMTGEEGLVARYTSMSGVNPPRREGGLESPRFIADWMRLIDEEMEQIAGSVDVLRGEAPAGLEAYSALQALEAKAIQALAEPRALWVAGWAEWSRQMLGIFKEYAIDDRELPLRGDNGAWAIQKFKAADLSGGVRIIPNLTQQGPSSPVSQRASLEQAVRIQLLNPNDPQEKYKALEIIGLPGIMKDMDLDIQAAAQENDAFIEIFSKGAPGEPPAVNPFIDNHIIHRAIHRRFALSDKFKQLGPLGEGAFYGHMAQHDAYIMQAMLQQQQGPQPLSQEGKMGGPSASKTVKSEAGAASQPERANDMGKPQGKRERRISQMRGEANNPDHWDLHKD